MSLFGFEQDDEKSCFSKGLLSDQKTHEKRHNNSRRVKLNSFVGALKYANIFSSANCEGCNLISRRRAKYGPKVARVWPRSVS